MDTLSLTPQSKRLFLNEMYNSCLILFYLIFLRKVREGLHTNNNKIGGILPFLYHTNHLERINEIFTKSDIFLIISMAYY